MFLIIFLIFALYIYIYIYIYIYSDNEQKVAQDLQVDLSEKGDSVGSPSLKQGLRKEEQKETAGNLHYLMY